MQGSPNITQRQVTTPRTENERKETDAPQPEAANWRAFCNENNLKTGDEFSENRLGKMGKPVNKKNEIRNRAITNSGLTAAQRNKMQFLAAAIKMRNAVIQELIKAKDWTGESGDAEPDVNDLHNELMVTQSKVEQYQGELEELMSPTAALFRDVRTVAGNVVGPLVSLTEIALVGIVAYIAAPLASDHASQLDELRNQDMTGASRSAVRAHSHQVQELEAQVDTFRAVFTAAICLCVFVAQRLVRR